MFRRPQDQGWAGPYKTDLVQTKKKQINHLDYAILQYINNTLFRNMEFLLSVK